MARGEAIIFGGRLAEYEYYGYGTRGGEGARDGNLSFKVAGIRDILVQLNDVFIRVPQPIWRYYRPFSSSPKFFMLDGRMGFLQSYKLFIFF